MRDLSKPLASTYGDPKPKKKATPKKRRNYSQNVIDATVKSTTNYVGQRVKNAVRRDSQRTMTQDRNKLNKIDLANDNAQINLSKTKKGEKYMTKIMSPKSIKSKSTPKKTLAKKKK